MPANETVLNEMAKNRSGAASGKKKCSLSSPEECKIIIDSLSDNRDLFVGDHRVHRKTGK